FLTSRLPSTLTLFPYTTLFRSHALRLDAELGLGVVVDVVAGPGAELVGVRLRPEDVVELAVLEYRGRDADVDPEELLALVDLLHHRHALRARVDAGEDVELLVVGEARHLVD